MRAPSGQMEDEEEALLHSTESAEAGPPEKRKPHIVPGVSRGVPPSWWSPLGLMAVLLSLALTVWSLPAPTLSGKLELLRQSWRLNAVLDEIEHLREQINTAKTDKASLTRELAGERERSVELQQRLEGSGGREKTLRRQLADEQTLVTGLKGSNKGLEKQVERERKLHKELLHKLQRLKQAELSDLAQLDAVEKKEPDAAAMPEKKTDPSTILVKEKIASAEKHAKPSK